MKKFATGRLIIKKIVREKLAATGQENTNDRTFKFFGKNFHKNHRGFVVIGQK